MVRSELPKLFDREAGVAAVPVLELSMKVLDPIESSTNDNDEEDDDDAYGGV